MGRASSGDWTLPAALTSAPPRRHGQVVVLGDVAARAGGVPGGCSRGVAGLFLSRVLALRLAGKRELAQLDSSDLEVTGITPLHGLGSLRAYLSDPRRAAAICTSRSSTSRRWH
jgi:hypothetical protein